jgi:hypothetical protein
MDTKTRHPINGAFFMRARDTFVVHVFATTDRQQVSKTQVFANFACLDKAYPGLFESSRHLRRFVNKRYGKRRKRGDIRDRMNIQAVHMDAPVWISRGKAASARSYDPEEKTCVSDKQ